LLIGFVESPTKLLWNLNRERQNLTCCYQFTLAVCAGLSVLAATLAASVWARNRAFYAAAY
jgi:hypothetical protein